jgi:hypothetical protein
MDASRAELGASSRTMIRLSDKDDAPKIRPQRRGQHPRSRFTGDQLLAGKCERTVEKLTAGL